ncbi:metal ABC transporter permease [Vibrio nigripulchritudo]|uniref:metal ABC transporter permease n=1 Tax=Vibrio nigripulchritudo TaxID=28173 RepID=UPI0005FA784F|nr:metal ABC transporter permease [Vibrio nigripulchritudo]KJY80372.1 zinc ABC transporter permease [Vibrio nigripulchritudo]
MAYSWIVAPALVGLFALFANIILGRQVLQRGVIFIDLAMAQTAALGVLFVELSAGHAGVDFTTKLLASWLLTVPAALLLSWLEDKVKHHLEALIGLLYVLAACAAVIMVSHNPHGKEMISGLLNGRLLWSTPSDILPVFCVAFILANIQIWRPGWLAGRGFYVLFALAIPALVISLGVYLEFACLIIPALAVIMSGSRRIWLSALAIGVIGGVGGFYASLLWDYPIGPSVVLAMAATGFVYLLVSKLSVGRVPQRQPAD